MKTKLLLLSLVLGVSLASASLEGCSVGAGIGANGAHAGGAIY